MYIRRPKRNIERNQLIVALYHELGNTRVVGEAFGMTRQAVSLILQKSGAQARPFSLATIERFLKRENGSRADRVRSHINAWIESHEQ